MDLLPEKPMTIHTDEMLAHRGPWRFFVKAMPGGFSPWGIQFIVAWIFFHILTALSWVAHLKTRLGNSSLANDWGELLTARDVWEIMENGKLQDSFLGFWTIAIGVLAILWVLWAGWKLQAKTVLLKADFLPWAIAILSALLIGYLPLWVLHAFLWNVTNFFGNLGIQFLGWINIFVNPLIHMAFASALMVQWWLCRLDLSHHFPKCKRDWIIHLKDSFLRLWTRPVQWGNIIFFGVAIRTGLAFLVLLLAWRWGGEILSHLWMFFLLQVLVAAINACIIGWVLRLTALYWENDSKVRSEVRRLESSVQQKRSFR